MHKQMGDKVKQDEAISIEQMIALVRVFEEDWVAVKANKQHLAIKCKKSCFRPCFQCWPIVER
jgi:hypothetical protein